jgi:hypothetical protein
MKKRKPKVLEPKVTISVSVRDDNDEKTETLYVSDHDTVSVDLKYDLSGWAFASAETVALLRRDMHFRMDRLLDRFEYR